ncbi:MAG: hypothetical protein COU27_02165, partial [Candidatus Levybacteria bacterium CG10_big_fil_rev_8_21_14_0_10_36_7]
MAYNLKFNLKSLTVVSILLFTILLFGLAFVPSVLAQETDLSVQENVDEALLELSELAGQEIKTKEDGRVFCNQERFLADCADIGKKHKLYNKEREKEVDEVLGELRGDVVSRLQSCTTEECLLEAASELSQKITSKNSALAEKFDLTTQKIEQKREIGNVA